MYKLDEPLNAEERYLHGINIRLGILIEMFSSFLDVYAKEEEVATSENTVEPTEGVEEKEATMVGEDVEDTVDKIIDFNNLTKTQVMDYLDYNGIDYLKGMLKSELVELAQSNL